MLDLIIHGGTVIDGTGAPRYRADVAIEDGAVVAIAADDSLVSAGARTTIDATGRVVCPGFVDIHTHYDAQILWDRMLTVSPWHGVTTVVIGNCGFGVAPTRPAHRELIIRTLEKVEGMSADALRAGLGTDWPFETFPDYLDAIEGLGTAINVAALIGHTPLRLSVLGEDATQRDATPDEIAAMRLVVEEALAAGAIGFATSKSDTHIGYGGRPVPSRAANLAEIVTIAGALGDADRGIVQSTMGSGFSFGEFAELWKATGRPISWTALLAGAGGPGTTERLLAESSRLLDAGMPLHAQMSCRPLMIEFTLAEPFPFESMEIFGPVSAATEHADKVAIYRDEAFRKAFRDTLAERRGGALNASWEHAVVSWFPPDPSLEGRNVAELAAEGSLAPSDLAIALSLESDLEGRFRMAMSNFDDDAVEVLLTDPHTMLGLSDAGAHAGQLCDACFSTHLLSHWVRDRKALTLEDAVRKLTSEPADIFGISDRGRLAPGRPADVVVFDPVTVGCSELRRVHDQPAGEARLVADATGIDHVIVNGVVIRSHGVDLVDAVGPVPGRLLRGGSA